MRGHYARAPALGRAPASYYDQLPPSFAAASPLRSFGPPGWAGISTAAVNPLGVRIGGDPLAGAPVMQARPSNLGAPPPVFRADVNILDATFPDNSFEVLAP